MDNLEEMGKFLEKFNLPRLNQEELEITQEYWSGQPIPSAGDLPDPGIEPGSPALQAKFLLAEFLPGKPIADSIA